MLLFFHIVVTQTHSMCQTLVYRDLIVFQGRGVGKITRNKGWQSARIQTQVKTFSLSSLGE